MLQSRALLLLATAFPLAASAGEPDPTLGKQLQRLGYEAEPDDAGDYRILFGLGDGADGTARSQLTYVRSQVESFGSLRVREIWSVGYRAADGKLPAAVAERLLADSHDSILGGWVATEGTAAFVVKLPADADDKAMGDALEAATRSADAMEQELSAGGDTF